MLKLPLRLANHADAGSKEKVGGIAAVLRQVDVQPFQVVDVAADAGHLLFCGSRRWDVKRQRSLY